MSQKLHHVARLVIPVKYWVFLLTIALISIGHISGLARLSCYLECTVSYVQNCKLSVEKVKDLVLVKDCTAVGGQQTAAQHDSIGSVYILL